MTHCSDEQGTEPRELDQKNKVQVPKQQLPKQENKIVASIKEEIRNEKVQQHVQREVPNEKIIPKDDAIVTPPQVKPIPIQLNPQEQAEVRHKLLETQHRSFLPLQAIVENPPLSNLANSQNNYTYAKPLPLRTNTELHTYTYFQMVHSCSDLPNGWPVDHPQELDEIYGPNVNRLYSLYEKRVDYAPICPVDADPFLPWIHDVFPSQDGHFIEFVAHNKRRCRQDPQYYRDDIDNLEPQIALLQSVPIQRLTREQLAAANIPESWKTGSQYRLASLTEADSDAKETRFICQFHTLNAELEKVVVGETLSVYPYNYEHANFQHRRGQAPNPMLMRPTHEKDVDGIHNEQIWNAILHFRCPVPQELHEGVAQGTFVNEDRIPSLYVDVVPIRTPPREDVNGYNPYHVAISKFHPVKEWGPMHILPPIEQSGRWANVPICLPPIQPTSQVPDTTNKNNDVKENYLIGCLWASAAFSGRGEETVDISTIYRLLEWLTYHLEVAGFDKIIVYDNTEAYTNLTSLQSVTDLFPGRVERIPWKHRVCNNNRPTHPNAGERSSQYAAEASCRLRYGPTTEWMISFDTDEYLVPQGDFTSMKEWLQDSVKTGKIEPRTNILNFHQVRSRLNKEFLEPYYDNGVDCKATCKSCHCLAKKPTATFFESFCDHVPFPRPDWTGRAKKQIYRPAFVLNHFVHYAAVTQMIIDRPTFPRVVGYPFERQIKELTEAFMLHTKSKAPKKTRRWMEDCTKPENCPIGLPFPYYMEDNITSTEVALNEDGLPYNCWKSRKIHTVLVEKLHRALKPYQSKWSPPSIAALKSIHIPIEGRHQSAVNADVSDDETTTNDAIRDFEPGLPAVIATKMQGNSTLMQVEQSLCLLKYAYNERVKYDIVVFTATDITAEEINRIQAAAAPAKVTVVRDNPGIQAMVADLAPDELEYLLKRCNVPDASQLTWRTRCEETSSAGTTNMPIQYTWQAEFRSLHLWKHPAIAKYKYMMWLDSDGFCTKKWEQDPIAALARNDLAILFDHFPQGNAKGVEWTEKFQAAFNKTICRVEMVDGHLVAREGNCAGRSLTIAQVHGFFHVTNLDFFRSEPVMKWAKILVGKSKFSRMFDDQIGVTMPTAVLAGNRSWDMRSHGIKLEVLHSNHMDGDANFGGYLSYWKSSGEKSFPEAYGKCKVTQN